MKVINPLGLKPRSKEEFKAFKACYCGDPLPYLPSTESVKATNTSPCNCVAVCGPPQQNQGDSENKWMNAINTPNA